MPTVPSIIRDRVAQYRRDRETKRAAPYNEKQLRSEFLDDLLAALGWDPANRLGLPEDRREVFHDETLKVGAETKAPDYCFRVEGRERRFFLEAKKPAVDVTTDADAAYQLRRYGWSAKLPVSCLSNFEHFAVYDCGIAPKLGDHARVGRVVLHHFEDYVTHWDDLHGLVSRDAVLSGSLDHYAANRAKHRGTEPVDAAFLGEIESWRALLAREIEHATFPALDGPTLTIAVQRIIDRLVFLRICEDRGIEPYGQLKTLLAAPHIYAALQGRFRAADARFNSGLFYVTPEADRAERPDTLTPSLTIDDAPLRRIIERLYFPQSPYEFSVLPTDLLGQVYEQFLGKIILVHGTKTTEVVEKPELKKAGGIYYTPTYVVRYVVERTLGPLLAGKSPAQALQLKILDPACGSGSFLLGAYHYLLEWYRDQYSLDVQAHAAAGRIYQVRTNSFRLTTTERRRILLSNIHGVDIDPQAVEVTKLSLLLKLLEGESADSIERQLRLFHERALPDLGRNILCGNSIVGPEVYRHPDAAVLDSTDRNRLNPFDWKAAFRSILKRGGFDAIIGNPPYRRELQYKELLDEIAWTPFGRKYRAARMDLWYYFVHRALELLRPSGSLSFIVNSYFTAGRGAEQLISDLKAHTIVEEVFLLGKLRVFQGVSGQHLLFRVKKSTAKRRGNTLIRLPRSGFGVTAEQALSGKASLVEFEKTPAQLFQSGRIDLEPPAETLLRKLRAFPMLQVFGKVRQGIAENPAAINKKTNERFGGTYTVGEGVFAITPSELQALGLPRSEQALLRPYHDLCDLDRYWIARRPSVVLIYSTKDTCPDVAQFPAIKMHLSRFRPIMEARRETKKGANKWWHLHWPRDESIWRAPKVMSVQMAARPTFVPSSQPVYVPFSVNVFVPDPGTREHINYFSALLNSRLMWKWFQHNAKKRGVGLEINGNVLARAPVRQIDFTNPEDVSRHDRLVERVDRLLSLRSEQRRTKSEAAQEALAVEIQAIDDEVDELVSLLYQLSADDIATVLASTALSEEDELREPTGVAADREGAPAEFGGDGPAHRETV